MPRAEARVDLGAVERNAARLAAAAEGAVLCAGVKADGYGHGARPVAEAALRGGAAWLAVATAGEARELAGVQAPKLVLGALTPEERSTAVATASHVAPPRSAASAAGRAPGP